MFNALILDKSDDDVITASVRGMERDRLPAGEVLVSVAYSSLNYKDGLAVTGKGKIIRGEFPFVPGVDLAGEVIASESRDYQPGDEVIVTGWGIGERTWGGFSQEARVKAGWIVPLPEGLGMKEAMIAGTAGYTAMLSVMALEEHGVSPEKGVVVVTGASGGAGSFAVALLAAKGYQVAASTGSEASHAYLRALGAKQILPRSEFGNGPNSPVESARWAGAIDAVGGATLATLIAQTQRHGSIASYGNAGGHELNTTVYPFILRGVNLLGIDSNTCPFERRKAAWDRLANDLAPETLASICAGVIGLEEISSKSEAIVSGAVEGRLVVDVNR